MAFVNEEYSAEEKPFVDRLVAKRPPSTRIPGSSWWTVDRERKAFLALVGLSGGAHEGTQETNHYVLLCQRFSAHWNGEAQEIEHYVLVLDGYEICFSGEYHMTGYRSKGEPQIMTWTIHQLSVPFGLASRKKEVLALVREALDAQGLGHHREYVASVIINFNPVLTR